ncbi:MAG: helix-turn-helix domain-containing protein [Vicinamibacteria bacterium]|jgi:curved DNA-binding protein CbpA|nr:helix-turn-helix domain-containing protein [Vicinamibacteria bacterium]
MNGPWRGNFYELLGLRAGCGGEQIEKAYRFYLDLYAEGGLALYSLLSAEEMKQMRAQLREAFDTLRDPVKRIEYDLRHGMIAVAVTPEPGAQLRLEYEAAAKGASTAARPTPKIELQTLPEPVTGAALRAQRERRGVSLGEIAEHTKVSRRYLEYIESERFSMLPAAVYLRGFLAEYARAIGLDPKRTVDSYLLRVPKQED